MNVQLTNTTGSQPVAPFKVDTSAGQMRGEVSHQWASRPHDQVFGTLSALHDMKKAAWERAQDVPVASADFEAFGGSLDFDTADMSDAEAAAEGKRRMAQLFLGVKIRDGGDVQRVAEVSPTNWAFSQLAKIAEIPSGVMRKLPASITADMLNWQLRYATAAQGTKAWINAEQALAINSPTYGRIPDYEMITALMAIAGNGLGDDPRFHWKTPGKLDWSNGTYDPENIGPDSDHTFYGSDRDTFAFLVDDRRPIEVGKTRDGHPDLMFRGFYIQNSEVGSRALKIASFYLRGVCMNRNLWGVERFQEISIRHTSGAPDRWLNEARPALESFAQRSDTLLIEGVQRAKAKQVADDDAAALKYLKDRQFPQSTAQKIIETSEREEGRKPRSIWDFAQAVTAHARSAPNNDTRLEMELKAKTMLDSVA